MSQHTNTQEVIKPFTVRLPLALGRRLAIAAVNAGTTKQDIVQAAVTTHLERLEIGAEIKGGKRRGQVA